MTLDTENPALAAARTGFGNTVYLGGEQIPNNTTRPNPQDFFQAPAGITCASMRMAELRDCLIREISRTIAIGLQAQAALLDSDDALAIENLRRHWIAMRVGISPLAAELRDLSGGHLP